MTNFPDIYIELSYLLWLVIMIMLASHTFYHYKINKTNKDKDDKH